MTQGTVPFDLVVAATLKGGIGQSGKLPWRLKGDMAFFKQLTTTTTTAQKGKRNVVVMGRKTWESIPSNFRPLPNRVNVVLSRRPESISCAQRCTWNIHINGNIDVNVH
jgi:dihydrofolate reductase